VSEFDPLPTQNPEPPRGFLLTLRRVFLQGLVLTIPLYITFWILKLFLGSLDSFLDPVYRRAFGHHIYGLGLASAIVAIFLIGLLTRNLVGKWILQGVETLLLSIPVVKSVYHAAKELMDAFSGVNKARVFREVLLVEYPRREMYSVGFSTNRVEHNTPSGGTETLVNVYIPHPPNPTSGMFVLLPLDQVHPLEISVEEGLKLVLSGGIVSPTRLKSRDARP
jgi:uncharacterized membrane protein